jgi:hypothetical protein
MNREQIHDYCYSGFKDGSVILRPEFAASLRQFYISKNWQVPKVLEPAPGQAFDAMPADDDPDDENASALNEMLTRAYAECLHGSRVTLEWDGRGFLSGPHKEPLGIEVLPNRVGDFAGAAERTRARAEAMRSSFSDPAEEKQRIAEFKRARGWDCAGLSDNQVRQIIELEAAYRSRLHESHPTGGN